MEEYIRYLFEGIDTLDSGGVSIVDVPSISRLRHLAI
jgi:hypothetical protein